MLRKYIFCIISLLFFICQEVSSKIFILDADVSIVHTTLRTKFIEGNPIFMSFVAITLILGLVLCIERIIYLTLADMDVKKFFNRIENLYINGKRDEAINVCKNTRGPVATLCLHAILSDEQSIEDIERIVSSHADIEVRKLEQGCTWINLFISLAPSLGFLGTVIGMVVSFDNIELIGDISPTIVAGGMKLALITTIFGIIVAVILQIFYNYILNKIEHISSQMEEVAVFINQVIKK